MIKGVRTVIYSSNSEKKANLGSILAHVLLTLSRQLDVDIERQCQSHQPFVHG